ncbi:hypothetical protein PPYR_06711 [Photinus pyralis]|uniref:Cuticle protein n=1 Tax=Photinus pyralis TaxID=7054 RepID=A0A5N4ANE9_PHOPY|nr:uncharacterized protein LOC116168622 [Photinus pyralis]KAB0798831.1 hypothetical protein PPYR_06711 [Photinus pyralis]
MQILVAVFALISVAASEHAQVVNVKQDNIGNYQLKYDIDGISRVEQRTIDGNVNGAFSFIDPHGIVRKTVFMSGSHGFHAASPDIPTPVQDTPEVALAKSQHLEVLRGAHLANGKIVLPAEKIITAPLETVVIAKNVPETLLLRSSQIGLGEEKVLATKVLRTDEIATERLPIAEKFVQTSPILRTTQLAIDSPSLVKGEISLLRTDNNFKLEPVSFTDKLIQTSSPLVRIGQIAFESEKILGNTEKLVQTSVPLVRAVEAVPEKIVRTEIPVLKSADIQEILKPAVKTVETIPLVTSDKSEIPVFRTSVPITREFIKAEIPTLKSALTLGGLESLGVLKANLESPTYRVVELPVREIASHKLVTYGDKVQLVRIGNEGLAKVILQ